MPAPDSLGGLGERYVETHLASLGYEIVARNWRVREGEIDLIARHRGELVFIEVKTRRGNRFGAPVESVDARKQQKLRLLAERYLAANEVGDIPCRFDVACLEVKGNQLKLDIIEGAF